MPRRGQYSRAADKRSSGTAMTPWDLLRTYRRRSGDAASVADIAAVDTGEGRTLFCSYRGLFGSYPRRFAGCMLDLTRDGAVIPPLLILKRWQRIAISEQVTGAWVRPFDDKREAFRLGGGGQYARVACCSSPALW